ncbi:tetratricopeptide repeat protein [Phenylobacterium sp.]|uniref:tetratricopeptide repeat protein n=1 Tax=Phenylobacterium sp. TaxID=1871053 RepID=UPI003D2BDD9D
MWIVLAVVACMVLCPASALAQTPGLGEFPGCEWRTVLAEPALFCPAGRTRMRRITSEGEFTPQTIEKARAGDARALATVGVAHIRHMPGQRELGAAILQQAADKGDAMALRKLGVLAEGDDDAEAERLLTLAIEKGDVPAMVVLADVLSHSLQRPAQPDRARALRLRAAGLGDVLAMQRLEYDEGVPVDERRRWMLTAAEAGSVSAMRSVAHGYESGENGYPKDPRQATAWSERALAAEMAELKQQIDRQENLVPGFLEERGGPAFHLAKTYADGGPGIPKDVAAARAWYRLGVEHGDPDAASELGSNLEFGAYGFAKDEAEARRLHLLWEELEVDQRLSFALAGWTPQMFQLAEYHLLGGGLHSAMSDRLRDRAEGLRWARRAAELEPDTAGYLALLAKGLRTGSPADVAEADRVQARAAALDPIAFAPVEGLTAGMPQRSAPDILRFALRHSRDGERDEAVFWFYVAMMRAELERAIGIEISDGDTQVFGAFNEEVVRYATGNIPRFSATLDRVLAWNEAHPLAAAPPAAQARVKANITALKTELARDGAKIRRMRRKEGLPETTP